MFPTSCPRRRATPSRTKLVTYLAFPSNSRARLLRNAYLRRLTTEGENDYEVAVDTGALEMMQNAFESIGPAVFPPEEQGDYELAQLHQLRFLGRAFESLGRTDSDGPEYDFCREV
eukprot:m.151036 g.151036  ORF g.151036 m.151036 type:complete len:116 (+) comp11693_c0_seq4:672-1019(+)